MSRIILTENSTSPATPALGTVVFFAKSDGLLYAKDDTGDEVALGGTADAVSVGDGENIYTGVEAGILQFRSISAGTGISLDVAGDGSLEVSVTGGGEESTTVANLGTGEGEVYAGMDGTEVQLRTLRQGTGIALTQDANEVTIALDATVLTIDPDDFPGVDPVVTATEADGVSSSTNMTYKESRLVATMQDDIRSGFELDNTSTSVSYVKPWLDLSRQGQVFVRHYYNTNTNEAVLASLSRTDAAPASMFLSAADSTYDAAGPSVGLRAGGGGPAASGAAGRAGGDVTFRPGPKGAVSGGGASGKDGSVRIQSADGTQDALLAVGSDGELRLTVGQSSGRTALTASKLGRQAFRTRMGAVGQGTFLFPDWAPTNGQVVAIRAYQLTQNSNGQVTSFQLKVRKFTGVQVINNAFDQGVNLLTQDFVDLATMPAGTVQSFALTATAPDRQLADGDRWAFQVFAAGGAPNVSNLMFELIFQAN